MNDKGIRGSVKAMGVENRLETRKTKDFGITKNWL